MAAESLTARRPSRARRRALLAGAGIVALNVVTFLVLGTEPAQRLIGSVESWAYPGAFVVALVTNATIAVPLPYNPIVFQLMAAVQLPWLVALLAAAGSSLGESTGWWLGSQGRGVLPSSGRAGAVVGSMQQLSRRRWPSFWALAAFAAVPNPAFDVAGLVAGAAKVPYPVFLAATFVGRLVRFGLFAVAGASLIGPWS